jgi:hypothetical protein
MASRISGSLQESWQNLDELREIAERHGFTQDQFGYAIDKVGTDPHHVANELQRHLLMAALYGDLSEAA